MLTIMRITAPPSQIDALQGVIGAIDASLASGEAQWRERRGDGYVVDLCDSPAWSEHSSAIQRFVAGNREALALARSTGASLAVDVAVDADDVEGIPFLEVEFGEDLMVALAAVSVRLVVSLYCTWDASDQDQ